MQILVHLMLSLRSLNLSSFKKKCFWGEFSLDDFHILSSRSLIHSSVFFNLLLSPSSLFFISVTLLFWLVLHIFYLYGISCWVHALFSQVKWASLMAIVFNSLLLISTSFCFLWGFFLLFFCHVLWFGAYFSLLILSNSPCLSLLSKRTTSPGLEGSGLR